MKEQIGIDISYIDRLSEHIRESWNNYFYEYMACQYYIRFTEEEKSNYFGDLMNYFDDITKHLSSFNTKDNYHSAMYDAVAVLQLMFVQQDLIDETLTIFKLPKSGSIEKSTIRGLRNELVGHPVSRGKNNELMSSVFITAQSKNEKLSYLIYHRDNGYKFQEKSYQWKDIFQMHEKYLVEYMRSIVEAIRIKLSAFEKQLQSLQQKTPFTPFEKLVLWVNRVLSTYETNYSRLYTKDNILFCYERRHIHVRYQNAVNLYLEGLSEVLQEIISSINEASTLNLEISNNKIFDDVQVSVTYFEIEDEFEESTDESVNIEKIKDIHYEFGKLSENHPVFGVDYFIRTFGEDKEILEELTNMKVNIGNDVEYFSSYELLRQLFIEKSLLH